MRLNAWVKLRTWSLEHLARPRTLQTFIPQIDGLRFVAIMAVALYHVRGFVGAKSGEPEVSSAFQNLLEQGYFGVPLFFVLSGFIICRPWLGSSPPRIGRYFLRRLTRLEPPYIISLLLVAAARVLWQPESEDLYAHFGASVLYIHNLIYGAHSTINGVAWSLEVEWQFYVLAPLLMLSLRMMLPNFRAAALWTLILIGGIAYAADTRELPRLSLSIIKYVGFFAAGAWVATLDTDSREGRRPEWGYDVAGLALIATILCTLMFSPYLQAALPALTGLMVLSCLRGPLLGRALGWWPIYCIGGMCYTIYLYHFFVVSLVGRVLSPWLESGVPADLMLVVFALIVIPCVVVACTLPYLLIERPFMIWRPGTSRDAHVPTSASNDLPIG